MVEGGRLMTRRSLWRMGWTLKKTGPGHGEAAAKVEKQLGAGRDTLGALGQGLELVRLELEVWTRYGRDMDEVGLGLARPRRAPALATMFNTTVCAWLLGLFVRGYHHSLPS